MNYFRIPPRGVADRRNFGFLRSV